MNHYLGIDIGTSAVKTVLVDTNQTIVAESTTEYPVSYPEPLWAEQDPEIWWQAVCQTVAEIKQAVPDALRQTRGIGLSGQMHGAVFIGSDDTPLRPAMLWSDGRAHREAAQLHEADPTLAEQAGVLPMASFTGPKVAWLRANEPELFARTKTILLPKDYVRLKMTGTKATDMCDGAGAWLLDEAHRDWSEDILAALGISREQLPELLEGNQISGKLRNAVAESWGLEQGVIVVGGAGDCAAGAVGVGMIEEGEAMLSLGTGALLFTPTRSYRPDVDNLVHAFCHCLPERWFQMAAMLNGGSALVWAASLLGDTPAGLSALVESEFTGPADEMFIPYLSGERTPHNDPHATGSFTGLTPNTNKASMAQAVMEGVALSFAEAKVCLEKSGTHVDAACILGGGSKSRIWTEIIASAMNCPLTRYKDAGAGPAFGVARLARMGITGETPEAVCTPPEVMDVIEPQPSLVDVYGEKLETFRSHYHALKRTDS